MEDYRTGRPPPAPAVVCLRPVGGVRRDGAMLQCAAAICDAAAGGLVGTVIGGDGEAVGAVRAAAYSPRLDREHMALIDTPMSHPGTRLHVEVDGEIRPDETRALSFI